MTCKSFLYSFAFFRLFSLVTLWFSMFQFLDEKKDFFSSSFSFFSSNNFQFRGHIICCTHTLSHTPTHRNFVHFTVFPSFSLLICENLKHILSRLCLYVFLKLIGANLSRIEFVFKLKNDDLSALISLFFFHGRFFHLNLSLQ